MLANEELCKQLSLLSVSCTPVAPRGKNGVKSTLSICLNVREILYNCKNKIIDYQFYKFLKCKQPETET